MKKIRFKFAYISLPLIFLVNFIPKYLTQLTPSARTMELELWESLYGSIRYTPYYMDFLAIFSPLFIVALICVWLYFLCSERNKCDQKILIYAFIRPILILIFLFSDFYLRVEVYDVIEMGNMSETGLLKLVTQIKFARTYLVHITYLPFIWFAIENRVKSILKTTA